MSGAGRWGRVVRVVVAAVVGGACGASPQDVFAENDHARRRWHTPEELMGQGRLSAPEPTLEVHFSYDADAAPALRLKRVVVKEGYVPQVEPLETGYTLSVHAAAGDVLSSLVFQIPNRIFNPPPEAGESGDGEPVILRAVEFALTVPMDPSAAELRVTDPQGLLMLKESLATVPTQRGRPAFRSLPPADGPLSRLWEWLIETAEAATTDGTALDVTFVGDNYTATDLLTFYADVDRVIGHMLTYEPYASRAPQISFHSVDNTTVDLGCVHDAATGRLITCNQATVTSVVNDAGAPYDKIIVLVKDSTYGGSGGGAMAVSYNGSSAPQVAVHEFGHTLGTLSDEYNLYTSNGVTDGKTYNNCFAGTPPNAAWDGLVVAADYNVGCKYPNWYRSSSCSVMKSLSCPYFNAVSQRQLNIKLDYFAGTVSTDPPEPSVPEPVDTQAPSVSLTAPADGATVSGMVTISASATDDRAVSRVDFYRDGVLLGSDSTPPYSLNWNTKGKGIKPGAHTVTAKAHDAAGNSASASVTVFK